VLGTPPAFVLSQDQTLQNNLILYAKLLESNLTGTQKTRHSNRQTGVWNICTYLVFKDHACSQNNNISYMLSVCQELLLSCERIIYCLLLLAWYSDLRGFARGLPDERGRNVTETFSPVNTFFAEDENFFPTAERP
jgi:hypothetical protein